MKLSHVGMCVYTQDCMTAWWQGCVWLCVSVCVCVWGGSLYSFSVVLMLHL